MWHEIDWSFMSEESDDDDSSINRRYPGNLKVNACVSPANFYSLCQVYNIIVK